MDNKTISNIKSLGIDMIDQAGSGHPGIVLGAAPLIYTVYARHMNINTVDPTWICRDRFVLSAGHGSAMLYATLYLAGFNISLDDLKNFRRVGYKTPGHPEFGHTPGVDMTTGPLGQGIASAVGMAIGEKILENKFKLSDGKPLINYNVYALVGDGDLMEGVSYEACSLAGTLNLDNLIVLYDSNNISLDGDTSNTFTENVIERFNAMGWHTEKVLNGTNVEDIDKAINRSKKSGKPSLIEVKTIIGNGSVNAGKNIVHGKCLSKEDIRSVKRGLDIKDEPFYVDVNNMNKFRNQIVERSARKYELWARNYREFMNNSSEEVIEVFNSFFNPKKIDIINTDFNLDKGIKEATRVTNGKIMTTISKNIHNFIGGSADLSSSTNTYLKDMQDIKDNHYFGKNIWFGVREHSMGSILNGLALSGFKPFGSTFLTFSDYMKPAIRLSALMNLPVNYIFTHDSINIGPDGPTHQPIEQLAMLRSTPNLMVFRPADANELIGCWDVMLNSSGPNALVLSRQDVRTLPSTVPEYVKYGAYPVRKERKQLHGIIIATGTEVFTSLLIAEQLYNEIGLDLRVISMPCQELFLMQQERFKNSLIPGGIKTIVVEAGSSFGWYRFVINEKYLMTIDKFGISGTKGEVENYCNFTFEQIKERIRKLF
ncbi:MAG: transketolase [Tenericutes bacterium]|nr:transketolase [Mycoplasmatota bacterium]